MYAVEEFGKVVVLKDCFNRKEDRSNPHIKNYYYEVSNHELYNAFRIGIMFCLDYLRKHLTQNDIRDASIILFSSDRTEEIESLKNDFQKRLKNDYSFESKLLIFVFNMVGKYKETISTASEIKTLIESLLDN